jgi:MoaA/NifB/PqqE/SkfB family radical SAM enzyme
VDKTNKVLKAFGMACLNYFLRKTPVWAILYVTRRCNLSCSYCLFADNNSEDPSLAHLVRYLDRIKEAGCNIISITGGEPALRKDLPDIIAYCKKQNLLSYLNTNGYRLTRSLVMELGDAGLDVVNISLDSDAPNENSKKDFTRSRNAFDLLAEGREKYGYAIISNQVISRDNIPDIQPLLEKMKQRGIYVSHGISYPVRREFHTESDMACLAGAMEQLAELKRSNYPIITSNGYLDRAAKRLASPAMWECHAGRAFFTVDLDGEIKGCDILPCIGMNIKELTRRSLPEIGKRTRELTEFPECSMDCMLNCAFETSYLCSGVRILLQELRQAVWNRVRSPANIPAA